MFSRVDDPLTLHADGSVNICGPIEWEDDETSAVFGFVYRQGGAIIVGTDKRQRPHGEWMVSNQRSPFGDVKEGWATVSVVAVVHRDVPPARRTPVSASWVQTVEVRKA